MTTIINNKYAILKSRIDRMEEGAKYKIIAESDVSYLLETDRGICGNYAGNDENMFRALYPNIDKMTLWWVGKSYCDVRSSYCKHNCCNEDRKDCPFREVE